MPTTLKKQSTLTIRIDQELKESIMALAHSSGEDISTWIRRFFETIRTQKKNESSLNQEEIFSEECVQKVISASKQGEFSRFDIADYV